MTAAVSDFTVNKSYGKISRSSGKMNLELIPNNDVIASIKSKYPNIQCIAFSAQVDDELNFKKIKSKNVDYLVINNILENEFGSDTNKISIINSDYMFKGINNQISVGLYHSWVVNKDNLPRCLEITSINEDGIISSFKHKELDVRGVQFHPESILTDNGLKMIENWVRFN